MSKRWLPGCPSKECKLCRDTVSYNLKPEGVVFLHNRKCAGSSMRKVLKIVRTHNNHQPAWEAKIRVMDEEKWEKAFKFSFIRNPWDRWVALYLFRFKHPKSSVMISDYSLYDTPQKFIDYTRYLASQRLETIQAFKWGLPPSYWEKFTLDGRTNVLNFLGKYENLQEDWDKLCSLLDVPHLKKKLRNVNPTPRPERRHYTEYYNEETKDIIARVYKEDIERFEYTFGK